MKSKKLSKTRVFSSAECHGTVLLTADKVGSLISKETKGMDETQRFLVVGRIVSLVFQNHYHLTYDFIRKVQETRERYLGYK